MKRKPLKSDPIDPNSLNKQPPAPEKRKRSRWWYIIGAIILLFICGGIGSLFTNDNATAPDATEAPLPTATSEPLPTHTRELPPTATSEPAPTETPSGESAEVLNYRASIIEIADLYKTGLTGLSDQSAAVASTPALMVNDEWKLTTATFLAAIRVANDQVRALNPPDQFQEVHDELLVAADNFETMTTLYAEGVDEIDPEKLAGAAESMQLGNEAVQRATTALNNLNQP